MTKIYDFGSDANKFQGYLHASDADLEVMESVDGSSRRENWVPPRVVLDDREGPRGDHPCLFLGSGVPCLTQRAVEALRESLLTCGEVLSLSCDAEPLFIYNCTRFVDALDLKMSEIKWGAGDQVLWAKNVVWKPAAYSEMLFRLPQIHNSPTFMTETVRLAIEEAGLKGFLFEEVTRI